MKWVSHQATATSAWLVFGFEAMAIPAVLVGAVLPDMLDHAYAGKGRNKQARFNKVHRKLSHFWLLYVIGLVFCAIIPHSPELWREITGVLQEIGVTNREALALLRKDGSLFLYALFFGGLMHLLGDMCTPSGIPLSPFNNWRPRFSLKLFSTGSPQEYIFTTIFVGIAYGIIKL